MHGTGCGPRRSLDNRYPRPKGGRPGAHRICNQPRGGKATDSPTLPGLGAGPAGRLVRPSTGDHLGQRRASTARAVTTRNSQSEIFVNTSERRSWQTRKRGTLVDRATARLRYASGVGDEETGSRPRNVHVRGGRAPKNPPPPPRVVNRLPKPPRKR